MSDLRFEPVPILACVPNHHAVLPLKQQNAPVHVLEHLKRLSNRAYKNRRRQR